jgi:hypothetical protein
VSNSTGFYPRLQVDTTNSGAVGQAGGVLLTETIAAAGLGPAMSAALSGWRKPLAVHDPAKVVVDLAVTSALGGDCLADIALLRSEPGLYGRVASDATVSRTITALLRMFLRCWLRTTRPGPRVGRGPWKLDCETRYLSEQQCPDCSRPCQRLGAGGICPCCEEMITVEELTEGTVASQPLPVAGIPVHH